MVKIIIICTLVICCIALIDYAFSDTANLEKYKIETYRLRWEEIPFDVKIYKSKHGKIYGCDPYGHDVYEIIIPLSPMDLNGHSFIEEVNDIIIIFPSCYEA